MITTIRKYHDRLTSLVEALKKNTLTPYIVIIAFTTIINYSSFFHNFIQDDYLFINAVKNNFSFYNTFIADFFGAHTYANFYRPINMLLTYVSYQLFGMNATGYHVIVLTLFTLCCILVYQILYILLKRRDIALIASIFYLTRGALFLEIYWIGCGFSDVTVELFMLLSVFTFIKYWENKTKPYYLASLACFVLALMSKESAVILPALIFIVYLCDFKPGRIENMVKELRQLIVTFIPYGLILLVYLAKMLLWPSVAAAGPYEVSFSLATVVANLLFYVSNSFNNLYEAIILAVIIVTPFIIPKSRKYAILFSVWFVTCLLPYLLLNNHSYPHYESVALLGVSILVALGLQYYCDRYGKYKSILIVCVLLVLLVSGYLNIRSQENFSGIIIQEKTANNILGVLRSEYPQLPDNSVVDIKNSDFRTFAAMGYGGSAIQLNYNNTVNVYFEGLSNAFPENYSTIYYFNNSNDTIYFVKESKTRDHI